MQRLSIPIYSPFLWPRLVEVAELQYVSVQRPERGGDLQRKPNCNTLGSPLKEQV